ncbi:MAG: hypothetical protein JO290_09690 [Sphingomonadaceae bacterium]|nr:hypothetical protein [Sphingomonadaceae bacterium]
MIPAFDVALALRRIGLCFWRDVTPIAVLGFGMILLPELALALAGSHSGSTIIATFGGMLKVLYVVIVTHGALARLQGRPIAAGAFAGSGLAASPRALSTALLVGVGVVLALVALLLAGYAGGAALPLRLTIVVVAFAAAVLAVPAVPLALTARVTPVAALARAAALTRGRRAGIAVVLGLAALTIVPARLVLAAAAVGPAASTTAGAGVDAALSLASPGLWLLGLFDLLAWGLGATVPAAVFAGLVEP